MYNRRSRRPCLKCIFCIILMLQVFLTFLKLYLAISILYLFLFIWFRAKNKCLFFVIEKGHHKMLWGSNCRPKAGKKNFFLLVFDTFFQDFQTHFFNIPRPKILEYTLDKTRASNLIHLRFLFFFFFLTLTSHVFGLKPSIKPK